jgi:predicted RNase H-like nuclease (RuvC/YqgF family)
MEDFVKMLREKEKKEGAEKKRNPVSKPRDAAPRSVRGGSGVGGASLAATVSQLLKQVSGFEKQITGLQTQNTLMMSSLHDKHDKDMTSVKAASKKDRDAVTSLEREVAGLRDKNAVLCQDKEQLRTQLDKMHDDVTKSHNDVTKLQAENDQLKTELSRVKTEQDKLRADVNKQGERLDNL